MKDLYFKVTLNLFDGLEMLEELLEHGSNGHDVPKKVEEAILLSVCLFYVFSFLELLHLAFRGKEDQNENDEKKERRNIKWGLARFVSAIFQIALNGSFFSLRITMWVRYKNDAAIFIAKNIISIVTNVMQLIIAKGWVDDKSDDDDDDDGNSNDSNAS